MPGLRLPPFRQHSPVAELAGLLKTQQHQPASVVVGRNSVEVPPQCRDPDRVDTFAVAPGELVVVADPSQPPWCEPRQVDALVAERELRFTDADPNGQQS